MATPGGYLPTWIVRLRKWHFDMYKGNDLQKGRHFSKTDTMHKDLLEFCEKIGELEAENASKKYRYLSQASEELKEDV
jgi:hypothetical protein